MDRRSFFVKAVWDADAKVWVSDSDIYGLHIEAETVDEFEALMMELAAELIGVNHANEAGPIVTQFGIEPSQG